MTPRSSVRARAQEIYREMAEASSRSESEVAPTPDPSPLLASARGGGEKEDLTARVRALYEDSAVPVREIAAIAGVTERTIYKYVAKGFWKKRYRWPASDARGEGTKPPDFAPVKGAGGRFIRRADKGKAFATGLKATDPLSRGKALAACGKASRRSRAAQAKAAQEARDEALIRALAFNARCLADLRAHRQGYKKEGYQKGRMPSALQLRIEGLLIGSVEWSVRRLETFVPAAPAVSGGPVSRGASPPAPRYDPDDFRAWRSPSN